MWTPTHVKVTVHKARRLKVKGRSGANDSYVVIQLEDVKFTTSVKVREKIPEWNEHCNMSIPNDLRNSVIKVTVHNRNLWAFDDFLGETDIHLQQLSVYERPQSRWYSLVGRRGSGKSSNDEPEEGEALGQIQITVTFMVQNQTVSSDQTPKQLQRQRSLSFRSLASLVGKKLSGRKKSQTDIESPLTDLTDRKCPVHFMLELHNVSRSFHHLHLSPTEDDVFTHETRQQRPDAETSASVQIIRQDDELRKAETGDVIRQKPGSNVDESEVLRRRPVRPRSLHSLTEEGRELQRSATVERINNARNSYTPSNQISYETPVYAYDYIRTGHKRHSFIGCGETPPMVAAYRLSEIEDFLATEKRTRHPMKPTQKILDETNSDHFEGYDRDDLIKLVLEQQSWIKMKRVYVQDLEEYIDGLLMKILDTNQQSILQNPYHQKSEGRQSERNNDNQKNSASKRKVKRLIDLFRLWKH